MALDREQQKVLGTLVKKGRRLKAKPKTKRLLMNAATQTGLVEQNLHNRASGEGTSKNWRQETASSYGGVDRMNLGQSVDRFYGEALSYLKSHPNAHSWDIAANVQRPAAQYRGRYKQRRGEAGALLRSYGKGSPGAGVKASAKASAKPGYSTSSKTTTVKTPGVDNSGLRQSFLIDHATSGRHDTKSLLNLKLQLDSAPDVAPTSESETVKSRAVIKGAGPPKGGGKATGKGRGRVVAGGIPLGVRSPDSPRTLRQMQLVAEKQSAARKPYLWGGGHGATPAKVGSAVDCSGYVSQILGVSPRVSGAFVKFGQAGRGKHVTIYSNPGHVIIKVGTRWYATSGQNNGGGAGRIKPPNASYLSAFRSSHPRGM